MLTASSMVLFMTPGLAFFYGGMVSAKNVISTMLQCFIALGVVSIIWIVVGFSLAFGDSLGGVVGNPLTFLLFRGVNESPDPRLSPTIPLLLFALFQLKFAIITPALISGAFAERIRFGSYLVFVSLFSLFIYAPLAHWTWHPDGFLRQWGVLDFAGGTVVHMSAGFAALAGATVLGRRHSHLAGHAHVPAHIPFVILGTGMLWFGWFGFNAGLRARGQPGGRAGVRDDQYGVSRRDDGVGLLRVAARRQAVGDGRVHRRGRRAGRHHAGRRLCVGRGQHRDWRSWRAAPAAWPCTGASKSTIDDTLDVFPCHGVGGIVGMVLTAVFAQEGGLITGSSALLFLKHLARARARGRFTFGGSWLLYRLTDLITPLRVEEHHEQLGLDLSQHGETLEQVARSSELRRPRPTRPPPRPASAARSLRASCPAPRTTDVSGSSAIVIGTPVSWRSRSSRPRSSAPPPVEHHAAIDHVGRNLGRNRVERFLDGRDDHLQRFGERFADFRCRCTSTTRGRALAQAAAAHFHLQLFFALPTPIRFRS